MKLFRWIAGQMPAEFYLGPVTLAFGLIGLPLLVLRLQLIGFDFQMQSIDGRFGQQVLYYILAVVILTAMAAAVWVASMLSSGRRIELDNRD